MKKVLTPEEIYQRILRKELTRIEGVNLLKRYRFHELIDNEKARRRIRDIMTELSIISDYTREYIKLGVMKEEAKVLGLLEAILGTFFEELPPADFLLDKDVQYYSIDEGGHVIKLAIGGIEGPKLHFFPEELCYLRHLEVLYLRKNGLKEIPKCIGSLRNLRELDLSYNEIEAFPLALKDLPHLKYLNLQNFSFTFYLNNILDYIDLSELQGELSMVKIEELMQQKLRILEKSKEQPWNFIRKARVYPPRELLQSRNFDYVILWTLYKNEVFTWREFKDKPFNIIDLTEYSGNLRYRNFIERKEHGVEVYYRITPFGLRKLKKWEKLKT